MYKLLAATGWRSNFLPHNNTTTLLEMTAELIAETETTATAYHRSLHTSTSYTHRNDMQTMTIACVALRQRPGLRICTRPSCFSCPIRSYGQETHRPICHYASMTQA